MSSDSYNIAKKRYAELGADTDKILEKLKDVTFSIHGWQADDFAGFEKPDSVLAGGGLLSTGKRSNLSSTVLWWHE